MVMRMMVIVAVVVLVDMVPTIDGGVVEVLVDARNVLL